MYAKNKIDQKTFSLLENFSFPNFYKKWNLQEKVKKSANLKNVDLIVCSFLSKALENDTKNMYRVMKVN